MALVMTSGPAAEPVTLQEAKAHLRIDHAAEDVLISSLILTSRLHIEAALDLALIDQNWMLQLDTWPGSGSLEIPLSPLKAVSAVRVKDGAGGTITIAPQSYIVDTASRPPRIVFEPGSRPRPGVRAAGIEAEFTAGFGAEPSHVPAPLRHAILMLVAHWYDNRDAPEPGLPAARIPDQIGDLIAPFRKIRL
jgi:uncharacterized phiE125 gp8 family phage protein